MMNKTYSTLALLLLSVLIMPAVIATSPHYYACTDDIAPGAIGNNQDNGNISVRGVARGYQFQELIDGFGNILTLDPSGETQGSYVDHCTANRTHLVEYFCTINPEDQLTYVTNEFISCPGGCVGGVCLQETPQQICTDTDGGLDFFTKGDTRMSVYGQWAVSYRDLCHGDGITVAELYCDGVDLAQQNYQCPNGCYDGACVAESNTPINTTPPQPVPFNQTTCEDSDGGIHPFTSGVAVVYSPLTGSADKADLCKQDGTVQEVYCEDNERKQVDIFCPAGCQNGACLPITTNTTNTTQPASLSCEDSDGGYALFTKGITTSELASFTDFCSTLTLLDEYYCSDQGLVDSKRTSCPYGCQNGACLPAPEEPLPPTCQETDGGKISTIKGKTLFDNSIRTDTCIDEKDLQEYYCLDGEATMEVITCTGMCKQGRCQEASKNQSADKEDLLSRACLVDTKTIVTGTRFIDEENTPVVCVDTAIIAQKAAKQACTNNYECKSNQCNTGYCAPISADIESVNEAPQFNPKQESVFDKVMLFFRNMLYGN